MLLPGALTDPMAHAVTCFKIGDRGILVVMVDFELFRLPADPESMQRIMASVARKLRKIKLVWDWRTFAGR